MLKTEENVYGRTSKPQLVKETRFQASLEIVVAPTERTRTVIALTSNL